MTSPREALAQVLAPIRERDLMSVAQIAKNAGIHVWDAANAIRGNPLRTIDHLRLCAALGLDPFPEVAHEPVAPADFDRITFAMALRIRRGLNGHNLDQAAEACGFSNFVMSRLENAHVCGIGVVLKACRYLERHPFSFFKNGEMFHRNIDAKGLKYNEAVSAAVE